VSGLADNRAIVRRCSSLFVLASHALLLLLLPRLEFYGKEATSYLLFDAPQFAVSMTLSRENVSNHFISAVDITVRNVSFAITTKSMVSMCEPLRWNCVFWHSPSLTALFNSIFPHPFCFA
jgi:hypothetical protein